MKRKIMIMTFCIVSLFVLTSMSQAAAIKCPQMEVMLVGETGIWLKNVSGSSCGNIANGSEQYFVFEESKLNRQLAIALSSLSMNKNVWVYALGDVTGSIMSVISLRK